MKNFPADFDHLVGGDGGSGHYMREKDVSPSLSRRTTRTGLTEAGGNLQPSPSLHSLGVLGLRPVPPPSAAVVGNSGRATPAMQKSLPPTPALSQRGGPTSPQQQQQQSSMMMMMPPNGGGAVVTPSLSQRGLVVGPGEIPNTAGPFVNGGIHNTSDDSILTNQSVGGGGMVTMTPRGGGGGGGRYPPHTNNGGMHVQPSLESLGGSRYEAADPPPDARTMQADPLLHQQQPLGLPRTHTKLMPGRMGGGGAAPQQPSRQPPRPLSRAGGGGATPSQAAAGGGGSRPQSRASGGGRNRAGGVVPFTAV